MNVWMYIVYMLHDAVHLCKFNQDAHALHSLDVAAALWIGDNQNIGGGSAHPHSLYAMAESMGGVFGQKGDDGETRVNSKIIHLFNKAKYMFEQEQCSASNPHGSFNAYEQLRIMVDDIVAQMNVPLLQKLIREMRSNTDKFRLDLYAMSVLPQLVGCNNNTFYFMMNELVTNQFQDRNFEVMWSIIQRSLSCLRLTCEDIGVYKGEARVTSCINNPKKEVLSGYVPTTDNSTEVSPSF